MKVISLGAFSTTVGALCYGVPGVILTLAEKQGSNVSNVISTQYLIAFVVFFFASEICPPPTKPMKLNEKGIILASGIPVFGVTYCFYKALFYLGVPTATMMMMQSAWIAPTLTAFLKGTRIKRHDVAIIVLILTGVAVATGAFRMGMSLSLPGMFWGMMAALCYSLFIVSMSCIPSGTGISQKARLMTLGAFLTSLFIYQDKVDISLFNTDIYWACLNGVFACILPLTTFSFGIPKIPSTLAGMLITLELPSAYILSYLILSENISIDQISGCIIIVASIVFSNFASAKKCSD
ncbi:DMT family transporter [Yokenella regensburgei]|uniref:DMT family transporter n=1 Tax=Yokenella regensburgei TaxID=158877 RepID=UPI003F150747